jgi:hypothetical protein
MTPSQVKQSSNTQAFAQQGEMDTPISGKLCGRACPAMKALTGDTSTQSYTLANTKYKLGSL